MRNFGNGRKCAAMMAACAIAYMLGSSTAFASTGPQDAQYDEGRWQDGGAIFLGEGYLEGDVSYQGDHTVYSTKPGQELGGFPGVSYDRATNTLTLDGANTADYLLVHNMGDDFKIEVKGENALGQVYVNNVNEGGYSGAVEFSGTGSLTLNKKRFYDSAISVDGGENAKIVVDAGVSMRLYDDKGQYEASDRGVVSVAGTGVAKGRDAIQFRGLAEQPKVRTLKHRGSYSHSIGAKKLQQGTMVAAKKTRTYAPLSVGNTKRTSAALVVNSKVVKASTLVAAASARGGASAVGTVTLGKKVKRVEKGAFAQAKGLKTLVVKSAKLTKKNVRGAFKGSGVKELTVRVPASKFEKYAGVLSAKNLGVREVSFEVR